MRSADVLWTPSPDADENLLREGVPAERIDRVGNIMIDSYEMMRPQIEADPGPAKFGLRPGGYAVVTLHRPSNVDDAGTLGKLVQQMVSISAQLPLVFSVHPRTRKKLEEFRLWPALQSAPGDPADGAAGLRRIHGAGEGGARRGRPIRAACRRNRPISAFPA